MATHLKRAMRLALWTMVAGAHLVAAEPAEPFRLDFTGPLSEDMIRHGNVKLDREGPPAPEFPNLGQDNAAVYFPGNGGFIEVSASWTVKRV